VDAVELDAVDADIEADYLDTPTLVHQAVDAAELDVVDAAIRAVVAETTVVLVAVTETFVVDYINL
jgi:hypothetical protein